MSLRVIEPQPYVAGLESLQNNLDRIVMDKTLKYERLQETESLPQTY